MSTLKVALVSIMRVPKDHINVRILQSGSKAKDKGDSRSHGFGRILMLVWSSGPYVPLEIHGNSRAAFGEHLGGAFLRGTAFHTEGRFLRSSATILPTFGCGWLSFSWRILKLFRASLEPFAF